MNRLRRLPPLFFLGLFPVVILLWAWADSVTYLTSWSFAREDEFSRSAIFRGCTLSFTRVEFNPALTPADLKNCHISGSGPFGRVYRREFDARAPVTLYRLFPAPQREQRFSPTPYNWFLESNFRVPIWLILLAYLPLWFLLSFWQARRRQAKLRAALPAPAFPEH